MSDVTTTPQGFRGDFFVAGELDDLSHRAVFKLTMVSEHHGGMITEVELSVDKAKELIEYLETGIELVQDERNRSVFANADRT